MSPNTFKLTHQHFLIVLKYLISKKIKRIIDDIICISGKKLTYMKT